MSSSAIDPCDGCENAFIADTIVEMRRNPSSDCKHELQVGVLGRGGELALQIRGRRLFDAVDDGEGDIEHVEQRIDRRLDERDVVRDVLCWGVDLVRDAGGEVADRLHLLRLQQAHLRFLQVRHSLLQPPPLLFELVRSARHDALQVDVAAQQGEGARVARVVAARALQEHGQRLVTCCDLPFEVRDAFGQNGRIVRKGNVAALGVG
jgi:hypothetical protein